jgi:prepilin-type N-terminal cleavage/methylation domain-containing protein
MRHGEFTYPMSPNKKNLYYTNGFSLVELLVAASIIGMFTIGFVAMLNKGGDICTADKHRRQVRAQMDALFETKYHYLNYTQLHSSDFPLYDSIIVENRQQGPSLKAELVASLRDSTVFQMPIKIINLSSHWNEYNGVSERIELTKWIAQVF